jgi:cytochrome b pre-mRNA-processing protein 3
MIAWLKKARNRRQTARSLYGSIVTQARSRGIYTDWRVPDTAEGRFEMIALHLIMVLHRLAREGQPGRRLGQALTEVFATDIDDNLREMTVGDLAVPRQVKRAVAALQDRHAAYGTGFAANQDGPLTAAIQARVGGLGAAEGLDAGAICAYIGKGNRALGALSGADVLAGRVEWPQIGAL